MAGNSRIVDRDGVFARIREGKQGVGIGLRDFSLAEQALPGTAGIGTADQDGFLAWIGEGKQGITELLKGFDRTPYKAAQPRSAGN